MRRVLQRLVIAVSAGGRPGALSEAMVEVAFEQHYPVSKLRQLFAATAGRDVFLFHRNRAELQQLRVANKVLSAAWHVRGGPDPPEVSILLHQCDDSGISSNPAKATILDCSWCVDPGVDATTGVAGGPLPALMFDLLCGDTQTYDDIRGALVRMCYNGQLCTYETTVLTRQCACAVMSYLGEPRRGGEPLIAAVALLLILTPRLVYVLSRWRRVCSVTAQLTMLLRDGGDLRSARYDPLLLLTADEEGEEDDWAEDEDEDEETAAAALAVRGDRGSCSESSSSCRAGSPLLLRRGLAGARSLNWAHLLQWC